MERISPNFVKELASIPLNEAFNLPEKNEFIPTNFELKKCVEPAKKLPVIIENTPLCRVWFKQDDEYLLPKNCIYVQLRSPLVYADPLAANLTSIFVTMLKDELTEFTYNAYLAGLGYHVNQGKYGIEIGVQGYNEKQAVLLEKIVEKLATFEPNPQRFDVLKVSIVFVLGGGVKRWDGVGAYGEGLEKIIRKF